ncbi:putative G-protein coupled receptor B0563.6 [Dermacentor variabilis]|uniref:putative G-protein coupled receptor B0563.6 n=1 Tax=Dermacentor variabilis TaxID=34621 RepID=UPI003F5B1C6E
MTVCPNYNTPATAVANDSAAASSAAPWTEAQTSTDERAVAQLKEDIALLKFIAYGVISFVIIALGIIGNLINLVVLTRPNLKGVTFVYLTWLATSDLLTLVVAVFSMLRLHGIQPRSYPAAFYYAHVEMPLVNALMASSVFIVLAVTMDRYWSVCRPTRYREFHNARRAKLAILSAFAGAALLYIPVAFQKMPVPFWDEHLNKTQYMPCDNVAVTQKWAFKAYVIFKEVLVRLGPVIVVSTLNTTIIITFRKVMRKRHLLTNSATRDSGKYLEEKRLVMLLAAIVIMFCVCMTPAAILTMLISDDKELNYGFQLFRAFANDMEMANFAMNFYVYCLCSTEIRETFFRLFRFSRPPSTDVSYVISSKTAVDGSTRL